MNRKSTRIQTRKDSGSLIWCPLMMENCENRENFSFRLFFEHIYEDAKDFCQFKSKLQKERENDVTTYTKLERWIEGIPNRDSNDVNKIKNYR